MFYRPLRRRARLARIEVGAPVLIAEFGDRAYSEARRRAISHQPLLLVTTCI
jgi:hypothetical protein